MDIVDELKDPYFVGQSASIAHHVTQKEIDSFSRLSGDDNPLHSDPEFAAQQGHRGVVSHGILTAALVSRVIGTRLPGRGALWLSQEFDFSGAVHPGDTITAQVTIERVSLRDRLLTMTAEVRNQAGGVILRGRGSVRYPQARRLENEASRKPVHLRAVVLGASGSVGREVLRHLTTKGVDCVAVYRSNPDVLEHIKDELAADRTAGQLSLIQADVSRTSDRLRLVSEIEKLLKFVNVIVDTSGTEPHPIPIQELGFDSISSSITLEMAALVDLVNRFEGEMRAKEFGRIVIIGSTTSVNRPDAGWGAYGIAKAAIGQYAKSLAHELGPFGITSNVVAPGFTGKGMTAYVADRSKVVATGETPSRKLTDPSHVASLVWFLLSEQASNINGQFIPVDGGREMPW